MVSATAPARRPFPEESPLAQDHAPEAADRGARDRRPARRPRRAGRAARRGGGARCAAGRRRPLFDEAPTTVAEMKRICAEIPGPCLADNVETGRSPLLPAAEL